MSSQIDNFSNPMHIVRLKEVLNEHDIPYDVVEGIIQNLTEDDDDDDDNKKKELAKKKGLEHQQYGLYKDKQGNSYRWSDQQKDFVKSDDDDEKEDEKEDEKDIDKRDKPQPTDNKVDKMSDNPYKEKEDEEKEGARREGAVGGRRRRDTRG